MRRLVPVFGGGNARAISGHTYVAGTDRLGVIQMSASVFQFQMQIGGTGNWQNLGAAVDLSQQNDFAALNFPFGGIYCGLQNWTRFWNTSASGPTPGPMEPIVIEDT